LYQKLQPLLFLEGLQNILYRRVLQILIIYLLLVGALVQAAGLALVIMVLVVVVVLAAL
jgi:hypothetical protein